MQRYLIIKVLGEWWRLPVELRQDDDSLTFMSMMDATGSSKLAQSCDVIYDPESKAMIKNRHMNSVLDDAILLRMWLENGFPIFEYENEESFRTRLNWYHLATCA